MTTVMTNLTRPLSPFSNPVGRRQTESSFSCHDTLPGILFQVHTHVCTNTFVVTHTCWYTPWGFTNMCVLVCVRLCMHMCVCVCVCVCVSVRVVKHYKLFMGWEVNIDTCCSRLYRCSHPQTHAPYPCTQKHTTQTHTRHKRRRTTHLQPWRERPNLSTAHRHRDLDVIIHSATLRPLAVELSPPPPQTLII